MLYRNEPTHQSIRVKSRKDQLNYTISWNAYHHIMDLVRFYHESIYLLPDFEKIPAKKLDLAGNLVDKCMIKVNEVVFS